MQEEYNLNSMQKEIDSMKAELETLSSFIEEKKNF